MNLATRRGQTGCGRLPQGTASMRALRLLWPWLVAVSFAAAADRPSVLILPVARRPDYTYLQELHRKGFAVDYGLRAEDPLDWERLRQFNVLILTSLPTSESGHRWREPPFRAEFEPLLQRFQAAGGGVFVMLNTHEQLTSPYYEEWNEYFAAWGAALPLEGVRDPATEMRHPHSRQPFVYTDNIEPGPVSEGVTGLWFPNATGSGNVNFKTMTTPLIVNETWQVVVRGSAASRAEPLQAGFALSPNEHFTPIYREQPTAAPPLFAIRETDAGRMALTVNNPVFHVYSGTTWAHDRVMLGKGLGRRPANFDRLIENTLHWLAAPSLENGALGGYRQDPQRLQHPHFRRAPEAYFPDFTSYQNPVPPAPVWKGLVGARTALSSGSGTVADFADAARRAGLDFVVFLEDFTAFSRDDLKQLEADCRAHSTADLSLIPGYAIRSNIGNHMFLFGYDLGFPQGNQLTADGREFRLQNFDADGNLELSDEAAKHLLWHHASATAPRNIGYFNFANSDPGSVPVRNLRLYGMLGAVTYIDGEFVEDVTSEYLKLTPQGNPPRMCAVSLVNTPAALEAAVAAGQYLTHVAAPRVEDVMSRMRYGHQYGRDNVYPSTGPRIHAWAWTSRVMTFAGEPFVASRYHVPQLAKLSSDVGLQELRIFADGQLFRRLLLNGQHEFEHTFHWAFDRQRGFVLEVIDADGGRAVSTSFETWTDSNANSWCHDRQNGELWHGPFTIASAWGSGVLVWHSIGQTWDGGGALTPFAGIQPLNRVALWLQDGPSESTMGHLPRTMEGYTYATCVDDTVRNIAGEAWNVYAPGRIANAYTTLGPIRPAEQMRFRLRRTMYLPRPVGPLLDWHAMWSERAGGGVALFEGEMTILQDLKPRDIVAAMVNTINVDDDRPGLWVVRQNGESPTVCGLKESLMQSNRQLRPELGFARGQTRLPIDRGGYLGAVGLVSGGPSVIFNADDRGIAWEPAFDRIFLRDLPETAAAGDTFTWRLLYLWDDFSHEARNLARIERLRAHFGLDGGSGSGIVVNRGKLVSHFGLVDLIPEDGIVEFEVPAPDGQLDMPLPLRFKGFNPNWTIGQYQIVGYSTGFYTDGRHVWRSLGADDLGVVHLGVYTHGVPRSHSVVGHPVQCDASALFVQVTQLSNEPPRWYVAVNNPTDESVATVLRKTMDLPGFDFPDTPVELAAGEHRVLLDDTPPSPPPVQTRIVSRPAFLERAPRGEGYALRVDFRAGGMAAFQGGAFAALIAPQAADNDRPILLRVTFDARHVGGSRRLLINRLWGGGAGRQPANLGPEWKTHTIDVECDARWQVSGLAFTPSRGGDAVPGTFELDNVVILRLDDKGNPVGDNLAINAGFETDLSGWSVPLLERFTAE